MWRLVHRWSFFAVLAVFWLFLTNGTLYQSSKTLKTIGVPIVTGLPRLYQQCTNGVPIVKNSQKQSKDNQNSKNYHWCTNRQMSTKTVPTVYQQCTNRQKQSKHSQISTKMTIGEPIVTGIPRLYQQCNNRQQELSYRKQIARQLRTQYVEGLNITPGPWNLD